MKEPNTEIDYHFVHKKVGLGVLVSKFSPSNNHNAGIFPKSLEKDAHRILRAMPGVLWAPHSSLRGNDEKNEMVHQKNDVGQHLSCTPRQHTFGQCKNEVSQHMSCTPSQHTFDQYSHVNPKPSLISRNYSQRIIKTNSSKG